MSDGGELANELFDKVASLLNSSEGQRILLTPPHERNLGFYVDRQNFRLGNIAYETLGYEVPVPAMYQGFEGENESNEKESEDDDSKSRIICEELSVQLPIPTPFIKDQFAVVDVRVLAQPKRKRKNVIVKVVFHLLA